MSFVTTEIQGAVAIVTIDRPKALNALNPEVLADLKAAFEAIDQNTVRCVVLTGAGDKSFVAGADIGSMSTMTKAEGEAFGKLGNDVFHQMNHDIIPKCTYCINSGHGLHLYYLLEKPVPLYKHLQDKLREFKYELIAKVWNRYTSTFTEREQVQYQGIFQGFRMVGTQSKLGKRYPVKAFETGERVTIEYLNGYLMDKSKAVTDFHYKSDLSLAEARKKYPEWYEKRIVQGERRERWHVKRDLYDWWLRKIKEGASVGHRYSCLCVLASYAVKCDIPEDELFTDAFSLLQFLDDMSDDEHNRFTKRDILDAMQFYQENYVTYSRREAERVSAIAMPASKRNGRKQAEHLERARLVQTLDYPNGAWRNKEGRPKGSGEKSKIVEEWKQQHPDGKKIDCERETGLSRHTVLKWWK